MAATGVTGVVGPRVDAAALARVPPAARPSAPWGGGPPPTRRTNNPRDIRDIEPVRISDHDPAYAEASQVFDKDRANAARTDDPHLRASQQSLPGVTE
jgi:hypothetical protein